MNSAQRGPHGVSTAPLSPSQAHQGSDQLHALIAQGCRHPDPSPVTSRIQAISKSRWFYFQTVARPGHMSPLYATTCLACVMVTRSQPFFQCLPCGRGCESQTTRCPETRPSTRALEGLALPACPLTALQPHWTPRLVLRPREGPSPGTWPRLCSVSAERPRPEPHTALTFASLRFQSNPPSP